MKQYVSTLLLLLILFFNACSSETFIRAPWPDHKRMLLTANDPVKRKQQLVEARTLKKPTFGKEVEHYVPTCLDLGSLRNLLFGDAELISLLKLDNDSKKHNFYTDSKKIIKDHFLECWDSEEGRAGLPTEEAIEEEKFKKLAILLQLIYEDNRGLMQQYGTVEEREQIIKTGRSDFTCTLVGLRDGLWDWFTSFFRNECEIESSSISPDNPGTLSLSTRQLVVPNEPEGDFLKLKERSQAELIRLLQPFTEAKKTSLDPQEALESMLKSLVPKDSGVSEKQQVEFTISNMANSSLLDDRFTYITAYLFIPPLPGLVSAGASLEKRFVEKFKSLSRSRIPEERSKWLPVIIHMALDDLTVRVEAIDNLKTQPATIELGSVKSSSSSQISIGPKFGEIMTPATLTLAGSSEREEKIQRELDKRSAWMHETRSIIRITQRGTREATISGSLSNAITLKIPKTSMFVLEVQKTGKDLELHLRDMELPLYKQITAIGIAIGTVRVNVPHRPRKEVYYTVVGKFEPLELFQFRRPVVDAEFMDLSPNFKTLGFGERRVGVYSTLPYVRQVARFRSPEALTAFVKAIEENKIMIRTNPKNRGWYVIVPCNEKSTMRFDEEPRPGQIWLGLADEEGKINPFESNYHESLNPIGSCPN